MSGFRKGGPVLNFTEAAAHVVAADSRATIVEYDSAFGASLRLAANTIDGLRDSGLPVAQSQALYRSFTDGFTKLVESRGAIVAVIAKLQIIQRRSNQAEVDIGCAAPWGRISTASGQEVGDEIRPSRETI